MPPAPRGRRHAGTRPGPASSRPARRAGEAARRRPASPRVGRLRRNRGRTPRAHPDLACGRRRVSRRQWPRRRIASSWLSTSARVSWSTSRGLPVRREPGDRALTRPTTYWRSARSSAGVIGRWVSAEISETIASSASCGSSVVRLERRHRAGQVEQRLVVGRQILDLQLEAVRPCLHAMLQRLQPRARRVRRRLARRQHVVRRFVRRLRRAPGRSGCRARARCRAGACPGDRPGCRPPGPARDRPAAAPPGARCSSAGW